MRVSVVVCEHTTDRFAYLREAVESVLAGTYGDVEVVVVSDGSPAVAERARETFTDGRVVVHELPENRGLLGARNAGAEFASGDVVAFLDDDAVADERWVELLVSAYEDHDAIAAGGPMTPLWVAGEPAFLPAEFYWLVGVTHRGFAEEAGEVRNTFGSNLSFRSEVFAALDGFDTDIGGRKGDNKLQGGETELCARMRREYGQGVYFVPEATVAHKVFAARTDPVWLAKRAFWQGYSKRAMEVILPGDDTNDTEGEFLGRLFTEFLPQRVRGLATPTSPKVAQLAFLLVLTACVGVGYLYGFTRWR